MRGNGRVFGRLAAELLALLAALIGIPVAVVSGYMPSAVTQDRPLWIGPLASMAAAIAGLTWLSARQARRDDLHVAAAVPGLNERRRADQVPADGPEPNVGNPASLPGLYPVNEELSGGDDAAAGPVARLPRHAWTVPVAARFWCQDSGHARGQGCRDACGALAAGGSAASFGLPLGGVALCRRLGLGYRQVAVTARRAGMTRSVTHRRGGREFCEVGWSWMIAFCARSCDQVICRQVDVPGAPDVLRLPNGDLRIRRSEYQRWLSAREEVA